MRTYEEVSKELDKNLSKLRELVDKDIDCKIDDLKERIESIKEELQQLKEAK